MNNERLRDLRKANNQKLRALRKVHNERLTQLIRVMREVEAADKPFDMTYWFKDKDPSDCGTAACAAGWACRDPWMQSQGLFAAPGDAEGMSAPAYGTLRGFDAIRNFFGLYGKYVYGVESVLWLFGRCVYVDRATPSEVVSRIEVLLAQDSDA